MKFFTCICFLFIISSGVMATHINEFPFDVDSQLHFLENLPPEDFIERAYISILKTYPQILVSYKPDELIGSDQPLINSYDKSYSVKRRIFEKGLQELLSQYEQEELSPALQGDFLVFEHFLQRENKYDNFPLHGYLLSYSNRRGILNEQESFLTRHLPLKSTEDIEVYFQCLNMIGQQLDQIDQILYEQEQEGILLPKALINPTILKLQSITRKAVEETIYFRDFNNKIDDLMLENPKEILDRMKESLQKNIVEKYHVLEQHIIEQKKIAPSHRGLSGLPDGEQYYRLEFQTYTGSSRSVEELRDIALQDLRAIQEEMRHLFDELGFESEKNLITLYRDLTNTLNPNEGEEVLEGYEVLIEEAKIKTRSLFDSVPRDVVEVISDNRTFGLYIPGDRLGKRSSGFYTFTEGIYESFMPTLTVHEVYPGHHFQFMTHREMGISLFRELAASSGYKEGWAVYAENLMYEQGFYTDPVVQLMHLRSMAMKAVSLIIDAGIHLEGWDENRAARFYSMNTGIERSVARNNLIHQFVTPALSASYYAGFIETRSIIDRMKSENSEDYDLKSIHREFLELGPMPFALLRRNLGL